MLNRTTIIVIVWQQATPSVYWGTLIYWSLYFLRLASVVCTLPIILHGQCNRTLIVQPVCVLCVCVCVCVCVCLLVCGCVGVSVWVWCCSRYPWTTVEVANECHAFLIEFLHKEGMVTTKVIHLNQASQLETLATSTTKWTQFTGNQSSAAHWPIHITNEVSPH